MMKQTIWDQCNRCARRNCRKKVKPNCKFRVKPVSGWKLEEVYKEVKRV